MKKKQGSIVTKLMTIMIPLMIVSILAIMLTSVWTLEKEMTSAAKRSLKEESAANTNKISTWSARILGELNSIQGTLENVDFKSDKEELAYLTSTLELDPAIGTGVYEGDATGVYLDGSGWEPGDDYVVTERGWYQEGLSHTTFAFGEPYVDAETGNFVVSATTLLNRSDKKEMVASADVALGDVTQLVSDISIMDTKSGYGFLIDTGSNMILAHKNADWNAKQITTSDTNAFMAKIAGLVSNSDGAIHSIMDNKKAYYVILTPVENTNWVLVSCVSKNEVLAQLYRTILIYLVAAAVMIVVITVIVGMVIRKSIKPVKGLTENLTQITDGDFTVTITENSNDEIGMMSMALKNYIQIMQKIIADIRKISGDLDENAGTSKKASTLLSKTAIEQQESMQNMHTTINELANSVSALAEDATTLAQIVDTTNENGAKADERMSGTVIVTNQGHEDMIELQRTMERIVSSVEELSQIVEDVGKSTTEINDIVQQVESIADQTNLLSLNASIEAARAGEAGKGFAVVAGEIGHLADVSAQSTHQISEIIAKVSGQVGVMVDKTRDSVSVIGGSSESLNKACDTFDKIMSDVNQTSSILSDIMNQIKHVDEVATNMAAITEEQSASAEEILASIEVLTEHSNRITEESKQVENSANVVAESSVALVEHMKYFKI